VESVDIVSEEPVLNRSREVPRGGRYELSAVAAALERGPAESPGPLRSIRDRAETIESFEDAREVPPLADDFASDIPRGT
jgi:hypothetical protein